MCADYFGFHVPASVAEIVPERDLENTYRQNHSLGRRVNCGHNEPHADDLE